MSFPTESGQGVDELGPEVVQRHADAQLALDSDLWHEVKIVVRMDGTDETAQAGLRRELSPVATEMHSDGRDLSVRFMVPAANGRDAAELAVDLVEGGACRAGAQLVQSNDHYSDQLRLESAAVSA